jgi:DNA-3-methyladenine glycosylase II
LRPHGGRSRKISIQAIHRRQNGTMSSPSLEGPSPQGIPSAAALRALDRRDPDLGRARRRVAAFPGFPVPGQAGSHFHALARSIIYQQLAGAAAKTIHDRVQNLTPGRRFPRPEELEALTDARLRGAGLSAAKLASLRDLSDRVLRRTLPLTAISRCSDDEVTARLVEVRGIGPWTAQMFLMFRLGRLDVLAPGDLGLQEGMRRLDGLDERPGPRDLAARGERWAPLRSVASWVLWRLTEE